MRLIVASRRTVAVCNYWLLTALANVNSSLLMRLTVASRRIIGAGMQLLALNSPTLLVYL